MKVLVIVSHPRRDSLTLKVAHAIGEGIVAKGNSVEILDLYREKFDPITYIEDEADYDNIEKVYSETVLNEMERIRKVDTIIFVFPIYWHSLPAMLKGYIDRVFNYGFAYGNGNKLPINKIRWVPLAGNIRTKYKKRGYNLNIEHQLNIGIADYVGIDDSEVDFIWDSLGENIENTTKSMYFENLIKNAYQYGKNV